MKFNEYEVHSINRTLIESGDDDDDDRAMICWLSDVDN